MSLVVAAHNQADIVVGFESFSTYTTQAGQPFVPGEEARKVHEINPHLALMITGIYSGKTVQFIKEYEYAVSDVTNLEAAFQELFIRNQARGSTSLDSREGFKIGLAGYIDGRPSFRFVIRQYNDPDIGYVETYPINYYLSGHEESVELAERVLGDHDIAIQPTTPEIEKVIQRIFAECIDRYPEALGEPIETLVLSKP
jgi:hypothetical protein